jgi:hypothetical protein
MAKDPVVFTLANQILEILPREQASCDDHGNG